MEKNIGRLTERASRHIGRRTSQPESFCLAQPSYSSPSLLHLSSSQSPTLAHTMKYSHLSRSLKYSYLHQSLTEKRNISIWNDPWPNEKYSPLGRSLKYSYRHRSLTKRNISISVDRWPVDNSGLHFEIPCVEHAEVVDMRTCFMKVPPQEVLSVFNLCKIFNL